MPKFQIKRKTRNPEPEVVPEEKYDENEERLETESESSEPSEPLTEQMETLEVAETPQRQPKVQFDPRFAPRRRPAEASLARQQALLTQQDELRRYQQLVAREKLGQRRSIQYPKPLKNRNGRRNLQYSSHYGPNAAAVSTQEKARQLYYSCFG